MATADRMAHRAHQAVYRAIKRGILPHPYGLDCSVCGIPPSEYHHPDYNDVLRVVPHCRWCHKREHKRLEKMKDGKRNRSTQPTGKSSSRTTRGAIATSNVRKRE